MSTEPDTSTTPTASASGVHNNHSALPAVLDKIGFTRAQFWVMMLIMAGMFFDTLEQNSPGAIGTNLKDALGIDNDELARSTRRP